MQTTANTTTNTNNNALLTSGGCARLLVAARLPLLSSLSEEEEQPSLSFEELNAALRQRTLLAAADRLFPALVAAAEVCHHGALDEPPQVRCHTRTLFTACMIEAHPHQRLRVPDGAAGGGAVGRDGAVPAHAGAPGGRGVAADAAG